MTFFDKFFTNKRRNHRSENIANLQNEHLSFRSSVFDITKEQIRVVLFRECDRRGRKLLFDSNSVEKLPLDGSVENNALFSKSKCVKLSSAGLLDCVEISNSHGYKYKKPCSDVTLIGEMIFGSVAMVFKGENTCKVHSLSSPKCVIFTNIIHAPGQYNQTSSENSTNSNLELNSVTSLNDFSSDRTSSSDSKLYKTKDSMRCSSLTYPCLQHKFESKRLEYTSEMNNFNLEREGKPVLRKSWNSNSLEKIIPGQNTSSCETAPNIKCRTGGVGCVCSTEKQYASEPVSEPSEMNFSALKKRVFDTFKCETIENFGIFSTFYDVEQDSAVSGNIVNSSLSSLRRRWMQSCSSSIDETLISEETNQMKIKTRTKLGMGLVVDLKNSLEDELERFLFNHSIVIESILNKLQTSVETAYIRKENFVDLTYSAFINCQQSVYELITGGKYSRPMWLTLAGVVLEDSELERSNVNQFHEKAKVSKKQDVYNNIKLRFLNDFCDLLIKFDTKDTNFFISTLLTAILTHHLSWVTGIAESDISSTQNRLKSVMKSLRPYNPIWAQLNDLSGILGSPLKSVRTIVAGSESNKLSVASIVQVLTYFIRCYGIVESIYDFDIKEIISVNQEKLGVNRKKATESAETSDSSDIYDFISRTAIDAVGGLHVRSSDTVDETIKEEFAAKEKSDPSCESSSCISETLKRSKSVATHLGNRESSPASKLSTTFCSKWNPCIVPGIEKIELSERESRNDEAESSDSRFSTTDDRIKKRRDLARVPSNGKVDRMEENLSPDEGYDTVDSCTASDIYLKKNEAITSKKESRPAGDDVLFVLGENEELTNLKKVVMTKSSFIDIENENSSDSVLEERRVSCDSKCIDVSIEENVRYQNNRGIRRIKNVLLSKSMQKNFQHSWSHIRNEFHELPMPGSSRDSIGKRRLDVCSVLGGLNMQYNSEQVIQGVVEEKDRWEKALRKDLALHVHNPVIDRNVTEALCIVGDTNSWEVSLHSSHNVSMDRSAAGVRIGMSQLVADMLESLLHICKVKLPLDFCFKHIEKKLHEIYSKSKSFAELLNSTEMCTLEYLTSRLDICVNDVPLLLSVATTHSPHISTKYGLTFT